MIKGWISEGDLKLNVQLSKNAFGTIFEGYAIVSDYLKNKNGNTFRTDKDEYIPEIKKLVDMDHS